MSTSSSGSIATAASPSAGSLKIVQVGRDLLASNDDVAASNERRFRDAGVLAVNVIASPGAGKTSTIVRTIEALRGRAAVGVVEGDIAGSIDTERVLARGARDAVQINTGGNCHLEAGMVQEALDRLDLSSLDIVFIENVGNLICPTHWALGEQVRLCLASVAEGDDKPVKYPDVFAGADVVVLNKIDLIEHVDFRREFFYESVRALNPGVLVFEISCRTGAGLTVWTDWLLDRALAPRLRSDAPTPSLSPARVEEMEDDEELDGAQQRSEAAAYA